jgi:DnaJ-class molecular chaperone
VAKQRLADTCGACHADPDFLSRHKIPFAKPVEAYRLSVHGRAVASGDEKAASCSDCHGSHGILPGRDPASKINHWRVVQTCGGCHEKVATTFSASVHGTAAKAGVEGAPVCTGCHGEHTILAPSEPGSLVNPARVSSVTCGHCHGDERLAGRYNLPGDKVPAFQDSYHGLALRSGSQTVANCASCHGVHNILRRRTRAPRSIRPAWRRRAGAAIPARGSASPSARCTPPPTRGPSTRWCDGSAGRTCS